MLVRPPCDFPPADRNLSDIRSPDVLTSFEGLSRGLIDSPFSGQGGRGAHSGSDYPLQVIEDNVDMDAIPHV